MAKLTNTNRLSIVNPELCKEWDYEKNEFGPEEINIWSKKRFWWICSICKRSWQALPQHRNRQSRSNSGCPTCNRKNRKTVNLKNVLGDKSKQLKKEWHPTKNGELTVYDVSYGSKRRVWWRCKKGHEWQAVIKNRYSLKNQCPYCSGRKVCEDNCLAILCPEIAKEWDHVKNKTLTPNDVTLGSNKKVWWICSQCQHSWIATVNDRSWLHGCPSCNKIKLKDGAICDSYNDAYMYLQFKKNGVIFKYNKKYGKDFGKKRYDFYLPEKNTYIEVTSFDKHYIRYFSYLRGIVCKKKYVKKLGANFKFIQMKLTIKQKQFVKDNSTIIETPSSF